TLGLAQILGRRLGQPVELFECGGQFPEADSLTWSQPPVLASGQLIEQAAAQALLEGLPGLGRLTAPGLYGPPGPTQGLLGPGAFQAGEGDLEPRRIQALGRTPPVVPRLEVLTLGVGIGREVVVARGGRGMLVAEHAAFDLQGLLEQRLGLSIISLV